MAKKLIGILVFIAYLMALTGNLFAQQKGKDDKKNAATYYSKAFDLMKYPK